MPIVTFEATVYNHTSRYAVVPVGVYMDGTPALNIIDASGEEWCTLTVCIPGVELLPGEYLIKTWSENEPFVRHLLDAGFQDTGKRVRTGFVEAEVWSLGGKN